jgi:hypothetical protein
MIKNNGSYTSRSSGNNDSNHLHNSLVGVYMIPVCARVCVWGGACLALGMLKAISIQKYVWLCLLLVLHHVEVQMEGEMRKCLNVSV